MAVKAKDLANLRDRRLVTVGGLVLVRQRPGTAKGVTFMTLEDETGVANIVVWQDAFNANRRLVMTSSFLVVHGQIQSESNVVHVVARRFTDLSHRLAEGHEALRGITGALEKIPEELRRRAEEQEAAIRAVAEAQQKTAKVLHYGSQKTLQLFHQATQKTLQNVRDTVETQQAQMQEILSASVTNMKRMFVLAGAFVAAGLAALGALFFLG